jgi:hypothetical protein
VTLVFCIGNVDEVTASATGQPYVQIVLNATQSESATLVLTIVMFILLVSCAVNTVTTSSRQLWYYLRTTHNEKSCTLMLSLSGASPAMAVHPSAPGSRECVRDGICKSPHRPSPNPICLQN